jgi:hypothetical protein
MQQVIGALTRLPMPMLILLGAGVVTAALWFATEGRRCGAGVWLLVRAMGSNFSLLH